MFELKCLKCGSVITIRQDGDSWLISTGNDIDVIVDRVDSEVKGFECKCGNKVIDE